MRRLRFPYKLIAAELEPHRVHPNPTLPGELGSNTARKDKAFPGKFASGQLVRPQLNNGDRVSRSG